MNSYSSDLKEILYWLQAGRLDSIRSRFYHPWPGIFRTSSSPVQLAQKALQILPDSDRPLFASFILTSLLLNKDLTAREDGPQLLELLPFSKLDLGLKPEELLDRGWLAVPLLLSASGSSRMVWALISIGSGPRYPGWIKAKMDQVSLRAVETAAGLVLGREQDFFFWPLLDPATRDASVSGSSLGLAAYLGLRALRERLQAPFVLAATGSLERLGTVQPVHNLEEKARLAQKHGFQGLICPEQDLPLYYTDLELIPCRNTDQAWAVWLQYSPDCGFSAFVRQSKDQAWLCANLASLPVSVLRYLQHTGSLGQAGQVIAAEPRLLQDLLQSLKTEVQSPDWDRERLCLILDSLPARELEQQEHDPGLIFDLALLQRHKCNHCGRIREETEWRELSQRLKGFVELCSHSEQKLLDNFNLRIVTAHNQYRFEPGLPFASKEVQSILHRESEAFLKLESKKGIALHPALGRFYGTAVQNYGFCGPAWLQQTLDSARIAMRLFGQGKIPGEHRQHCLRQHCYLVYAHLDADQPDHALQELLAYLQAQDLQDIEPSSLNPFEHACLLRYVAQTGTRLPGYLEQAAHLALQGVPSRHPWQLWLYNLGLLLQDRELSLYCLKQSVMLCLQDMHKEQTLVPMALLGLSALARSVPEKEQELLQQFRAIQEFLPSSSLSQEHFKPVLQTSPTLQGLLSLRSCLPRLFPFSYR